MNAALTCAAWVVTIWGMAQARQFIVPLLLASLLAFSMAPVVEWLRRRKLPEWAAVAIASVLLFLPALALAVLLTRETTMLIREFPQILAAIKAKWAGLALPDYLDASALGEKLSEEAGKGVSLALEGLKRLAEAGAHLLIVLLFAALMLASRAQLRRNAEKLMGDKKTVDEIAHLIEKFLLARIGIAVGVGALDYVVLKAFGSRYGAVFACILGASTFVPIVGFILGALPPVAVAIAVGATPLHAGLMLGALYLVSTTESHLVTPKLLGRQLNLNLLVTFVGLLAGEMLWGIWGMVLSIPLLGIARILLAASKGSKHWAEFLAEREAKR